MKKYNKNKLHIMYIEDDLSIAEIYSIMINDILPYSEIHHFKDGLSAKEALVQNPEKFSLIISDYKVPEITGAELFKFVNGQMLGIPFILVSGFDCTKDEGFQNFFNSHVRNVMMVKPVETTELFEKIKWCLNGESNLLKIYNKEAANIDEKVPLNSSTFLKVNLVPCDVYLRLNDGKYVKVINKKEIFERKLIEKLILKGVTQFFVNRSEMSLYANSVTENLNLIIKTKKKKIDEVQKSQLTNKSLDIIKGNLLKCGFSESLIETSDEVIDMQLELIQKNPEFEAFLGKFQNFKKTNTEHTRLVCYIMVSILKDLTWDSESTLHKMSLTAILQDITLPESIIKKNLFFDLNSLDSEEMKIFFRHPEEAAHIAKNFTTFAGGIEQYILEQHELPDGSGFPNKLNFTKVHPLSATLNVSDYLAHLMWKYNFDDRKISDELMEKKPFYLKGHFRKPYEAACRIFKI